jgi:hypothetical protein
MSNIGSTITLETGCISGTWVELIYHYDEERYIKSLKENDPFYITWIVYMWNWSKQHD